MTDSAEKAKEGLELLIDEMSYENSTVESLQKIIADYGVDVNGVVDDKGNTPLMYAIMYGEKEWVNLLLKQGADATKKIGEITPIEYAKQCVKDAQAINDETKRAEAVAHAQAVLDVVNGNSSKSSAVNVSNEEKPEDKSAKAKEGLKLLIDEMSDENSTVESLQKIIADYGVDVNGVVDDKGNTPLMYAIMYGEKEWVNLLLKQGADATKKIGEITPIEYAIYELNEEKAKPEEKRNSAYIEALDSIIVTLRSKGAQQTEDAKKLEEVKAASEIKNKNEPEEEIDFQGLKQEFVDAVISGKWDFVQEQLNAHPDLKDVKFSASKRDGTMHDDLTLLHMIAMRGQMDIAKQVIALYEDEASKKEALNAKDSRGNTPLHLMASAAKPSQDMLSLLHTQGADVNVENALGYTPLHVAAEKGHTALVSDLIAVGAEVKVSQKDGTTPLHYAGNADVAQLLIDANKEVLNQRDENGNTALHLAIEEDRLDVANKLMQSEGVDVNARNGQDQKGKTPLDIVEERLNSNEGDKDGLAVVQEQLTNGGGKTSYAIDYHRDVEVHSYSEESYAHAEKRDVFHRNKYIAGIKKYLNDDRRKKVMDNLTMLYLGQGYPEEEARKQARVEMYKLVQANLLYHPDEKLKGDKRTLTEMFTMNHRIVLDHLMVDDFSEKTPEEQSRYLIALTAIEEAISPDGFAIKPVYVEGKMSYDTTRSSGYKSETITVDTKTKKRVNTRATLQDAQVESEESSKPILIRSYDPAVYERSKQKVASFKNRTTVSSIRLTGERQETALKNVAKALMAQGYTEKEALAQAYVLVSKLEQLSLQCSAQTRAGKKTLQELLGFNHDELLKKLVSGELKPSDYAGVAQQLTVVESRMNVKGGWVKNPEAVQEGQIHPAGYVEKKRVESAGQAPLGQSVTEGGQKSLSLPKEKQK